MGISTDAVLFWGLCDSEENHWANLGRDWEDPDNVEDTDDLDDWEEVYAIRMGLEAPPEPYEEHKDKYPPFWDAKSKLVEDSGCAIDYHCCDESRMPYVSVSESLVMASRGFPVEVGNFHSGQRDGADLLKVDLGWDAKLRRFCEVMGIKYSEPRWWLVSWMG